MAVNSHELLLRTDVTKGNNNTPLLEMSSAHKMPIAGVNANLLIYSGLTKIKPSGSLENKN